MAEQLGVVYLSLHCFRSINAGGRIFEFGGVVFAFDHLRFMLCRMVEIPPHIVRLVSRAATGGKQEQGGGGKQMFFSWLIPYRVDINQIKNGFSDGLCAFRIPNRSRRAVLKMEKRRL